MKLDDLDKLAAAATPGPWVIIHAGNREGVWHESVHGGAQGVCDTGPDMTPRGFPPIPSADAAYIAACSPERIRAMVKVIRVAKKARVECCHTHHRGEETWCASNDLDAALAELERLP